MVAAVALAVLCDASQYLVITVRNKLLYSQYIHSPLRGGKSSLNCERLFEGPAKIHSQSSSPSDCLLCPTLLFFDSAIMMLGINRMVNGSLLV